MKQQECDTCRHIRRWQHRQREQIGILAEIEKLAREQDITIDRAIAVAAVERLDSIDNCLHKIANRLDG
jgi:hypothetical protein